MSATAPRPSQIHWQLDAIAHTDAMIADAMHQLSDSNEARWLVHRVMHHAITNMRAPAHRAELDSALSAALFSHRADAA